MQAVSERVTKYRCSRSYICQSVRKRVLVRTVFIILVMTLSQKLHAQQQNTSKADASAVVLWNLDINGMQDLQFDEISQGAEKIVYLDGTVEGLDATGREQAGKFRISTPQGFQVEFKNLPTAMTGPDGTNMPIEFFAAWSNEPYPDGTDLNVFDVSQPLSIESVGELRDVYLFLGARVTPEQTQQLGDYQVQVTLSIIHGVQ